MNTAAHLLVGAVVAWATAAEVLRLVHSLDRRRQLAARDAAEVAQREAEAEQARRDLAWLKWRAADAEAAARVDLMSPAGLAAICAEQFEPDFEPAS